MEANALPGVYEHAFHGEMLIKSATEQDGKWLFHAPAALVEEDGLGPDYDKEDLTKGAVVRGLGIWQRLGGQVDYDHLYAKTHNPSTIIGKFHSVHDNPNGGAPIVVTELHKGQKLAQDCWTSFHAGVPLGYSLEGKAISHDPANRKRITDLAIHMMTITPLAKGFEGPRLTSGMPTLTGLLKALAGGGLEGWTEISDFSASLLSEESFAHLADTAKAMTTGSGVVLPGTTGGASLRRQSLLDGVAALRPGHRKRKKKKHRPISGLEKALTLELSARGAHNPAAIAAKAFGLLQSA